MINLLPIIEQLDTARDHGERIEWLLQCPIGILGRYQMTIRNRLMHAGFHAGIAYLDAIEAMKSSVRTAEGNMRPDTVQLLGAAVYTMRMAAETPALTPGSVTDL